MLTSLESKKEKTIFAVGNCHVGRDFVIIAGPCAVEQELSFFEIAQLVKKEGAHILRGHLFKPRTSPFDFQGIKDEGFELIKKVKNELGLPVIMEATSIEHVQQISEYADVIQIGARNMQHFELLKAVGDVKKPILLKRNPAANMHEFLMAAEYIMQHGNERIILCERGIRSFSDFSRYTLDLTIVPALKEKTHLPVFVDPSHAAGHMAFIPPLAKAARACGADGLILEVHVRPEEAKCDREQALPPSVFSSLMNDLRGMSI